MPRLRRPLADRFWERVVKTDGCWLWTGATVRGYGYIRADGGRVQLKTHRVSWELHNGPLPPEALVCHHCDNPSCVNPAHLYVGTEADNVHDRERRRRGRNSGKTNCIRGHPLSGDNLYLTPKGIRQCRSCMRLHAAEWHQAHPEKRSEYNRRYWARNHAHLIPPPD
jgi:hypothetical protein